MATVTQFGLSDHGRTLTLEQFTESDYESGHKYELIEGRLYVTPSPNHPHNWIQRYIHEELVVYRRSHPGVIGCLGVQCRVFVP
ncbi:MAG: Uma2 family endonuclease, partial [Planctomycetes bacterium]|nr:Uma2 family endonuclease [Planctomycetota bacterium]